MTSRRKRWIIGMGAVALALLLTPFILTQYLGYKYSRADGLVTPFPISVDPVKEVIIEDSRAEAFFPKGDDGQALALSSITRVEEFVSGWLVNVAIFFSEKNLALAGSERVVRIYPGLRKEEVADRFGKVLGWGEKEKSEFLTLQKGEELPYKEGSFIAGVYVVSLGESPLDVQRKVNEKFEREVLSRYSKALEKVVPLNTALTIASLIERETIGTEDMRIVSGVIWNRIFSDEKLQLDATLQYAKASQKKSSPWWPQVSPRDKYIKSPYNTYTNKGLPPSPIANPSVAAIVAALNPIKTDCMFYFHDKKGKIYCSENYKEHVAQLRKVYGNGR